MALSKWFLCGSGGAAVAGKQDARVGVLKKTNLSRSSLPKKLPGGVFPQPSSLWDTTLKLALAT